jgi:7,8-dihydropterin-6-yl-methyl-4-(beta-D-ribofuranosyl)aminobenzene 5'-phosphate synthase
MSWQKIDSFTEIFDGIFLTGTISRESGEDTGGPFFLDAQGDVVDTISDEQALLFASGVLVQGCCHSGIINTLEHCKKYRSDIAIHTIIGGLHLLNASQERLMQTAEYLNSYGIKKLYALHCTGQNAIEFLSEKCPTIEIYNTI